MKRYQFTPPQRRWVPAIVSSIADDLEEKTVTVSFVCDAAYGQHQIQEYQLTYRSDIPRSLLPTLGQNVKVNFKREDWRPA